MSKVNVINPTDSDITVTIEGHTYTVEAKGIVEAEETHAEYWKTKLHNFLLIEAVKEKKEDEQTEAEAKAAKKEVEEVEAALKAQAKKEKEVKKNK